MTRQELEQLSELRAHPGWIAFIRELNEARDLQITDAPYRLTDEKSLWHLKGWLDAIDMVIATAEDARAQLEDFSDE